MSHTPKKHTLNTTSPTFLQVPSQTPTSLQVPSQNDIYSACTFTASFLPGSHSVPYHNHHQQIFESIWRASTELLDLDSSDHISDPKVLADYKNAHTAFRSITQHSQLATLSGLSEIRIAVLRLPEVRYYEKGLIQPDSALGFTLLHCCCFGYIVNKSGYGTSVKSNSSSKLLNYLLEECQCDPWAIDCLGRTALHIASQRNWLIGIKILQTAMQTSKNGRNPSGNTAPLDLRSYSPIHYTNIYSKQGANNLKERNIGTPTMDQRVLLDVVNHTPDSTANASPHLSKTPSDWIQYVSSSPRRAFGSPLGRSGGIRSQTKQNVYSPRRNRSRIPKQSSLDHQQNTPSTSLIHEKILETDHEQKMPSTPSDTSPYNNANPETCIVVSEHYDTKMGHRERFEDAHVMDVIGSNNEIRVYAVFDGHGGDWTANFCAEHLIDLLILENVDKHILPASNNANVSHFQKKAAEALTRVCVALDKKIQKEAPTFDASGCTGLIVLITSQHIFTCNIGDCRAVLIPEQDVSSIDLSFDFSAPNIYKGNQNGMSKCSDEIERIQLSGGKITTPTLNAGSRIQAHHRVSLEPTRGFGDSIQKSTDPETIAGIITCMPEISIIKNTGGALIIACDGVFDQMSSLKASELVRGSLKQGSAKEACEHLLQECLKVVYDDKDNNKLSSCDNMSAIVVQLEERKEEVETSSSITWFDFANQNLTKPTSTIKKKNVNNDLMEWDSADKTAEEQLILDFRLIVKSSKGLKLYRDGKDSKMLLKDFKQYIEMYNENKEETRVTHKKMKVNVKPMVVNDGIWKRTLIFMILMFVYLYCNQNLCNYTGLLGLEKTVQEYTCIKWLPVLSSTDKFYFHSGCIVVWVFVYLVETILIVH